MEKLLEQIQRRTTLSDELKAAIEQEFEKQECSKSKLVLKEHQYCRKLYFLENGTARTFYYHDGKEVTSWFYRESQFFSAWYSFYNQQQSFEYIEVLEGAIIYSIDYDRYQFLLKTSPFFERFGRKLAEEQTAFIDQFSKGFMFMTAKEKYDLLLEYMPDITLRVNLGHIASFLGITQETLSRIRKK